jgi:hypothetical protein
MRQTRSASKKEIEGEITSNGPLSVQAPVPKPKTATPEASTLEILAFESPGALETWLAANHAITTQAIWVKLAKKSSGIPSVTYDELVDLALCYGWIDGQRKSHDEFHFVHLVKEESRPGRRAD